MFPHRNPDVFEAKTIVSAYSAAFRTLCARVNDFTFHYCEMSEREDLAKVTSTVECPHRAYEKQRAVHALNNLSDAVGEFHASCHGM